MTDTLFELTGVRSKFQDCTYIWPMAGDLSPATITFRASDPGGWGAYTIQRMLDYSGGTLCVDIETTGLDVYSADFSIRLVQLGNHNEALVLIAGRYPDLIRYAIERADRIIVHTSDNFDLLALDHAGIVPLEVSLPKTVNTHILAHLLDPRAKGEGSNAIGHQLEALCRHYGVDPDAKEAKDALKEVFRKEYKATLSTGWAAIDIDHPVYVQYAGLDVIHGFRLYERLADLIRERGLTSLSRYEHSIARITAQMSRRGMALDVPYTEQLVVKFTEEALIAADLAKGYGVENVNSNDQIAEALKAMGWRPERFTATGKPSVDKDVLTKLEDKYPLAKAVRDAKRAGKWRESYAQAMLDVRDADNRVHPKLSPLKARTARMAVSRPPFQQLPSRDAGGDAAWLVRRSVLADPGELIVSVDYATLEMRLLAIMADVQLLKEAILSGQDLHEFTAALLYGPNFTKNDRKIAKNVGYGKVYGGGAAGVARLTGAPLDAVRKAIAEYDRVFPEIRSYADRLRSEVLANDLIVRTPNDRPLPVDGDRIYAAVNYVIQSFARDILADALIRADEAGLTPYMLLPIHDEILCSVPARDAAEVGYELGRLMAIPDLRGIPIDTDVEVGGSSWGSLYGAPDDMKEAA